MSLSASLDQPALDQLIRHAHLFGTGVSEETGEQEAVWRSADLARLRIELDELDAGRKSKQTASASASEDDVQPMRLEPPLLLSPSMAS